MPVRPSTFVRSSSSPFPASGHLKPRRFAGFFRERDTAGPARGQTKGLEREPHLAKPWTLAHRFAVLLYLSAWVLALQPRIYGGDIAKTCEFPTTVYAKGCTGTLVHPRVVLSAGHCPEPTHIDFGESIANPALRIPVKWCESTSFASTDARICVLERSVDGLPIAPILQGCEIKALKANAQVWVAGFGLDDQDPASGAQLDEKRWVATTINQVAEQELSVGGSGKGGCQGDSGGPVYLKLADGSYRTIGVTHGGTAHPNCDQGIYKRSDQLLPWYEEKLRANGEGDIDLSPCFDDDGNWAPTQDCGGFSKDVRGPHGNWASRCGQGVPTLRYSASCGAPFDPSSASTTTGSSPSTQSPPTSPLPPTQDSTSTSPSRSPLPAPVAAKEPKGPACSFDPEPSRPKIALGLLILALALRSRPRR